MSIHSVTDLAGHRMQLLQRQSHDHQRKTTVVLRFRHDGYISVIFAKDLLQLTQHLGILYQQLLYILYFALTQGLRLALRRSIPLHA